MMDPERDSWTDEMSGRERVRVVVETLDGAAAVQEIADRAGVSRATADDELERLEADKWVQRELVDGKKGYDLNPIKLFFDELLERITEHSREDLEADLEDLLDEREALVNEFDAESLVQLRDRLVDDDDLTAQTVRELRNVAVTWETINTEITLVRHALRLYGDVTDLTTADAPRTPIFS